MKAVVVVRVALAASVAAIAYLLLVSIGNVSVIGISAVAAAAVSVPVIATGSFFWGPNGVFYRSSRAKINYFVRLPTAVSSGLVVSGVGLVAFAHFTFSPTVGAIGLLALTFALESHLIAREFRADPYSSSTSS